MTASCCSVEPHRLVRSVRNGTRSRTGAAFHFSWHAGGVRTELPSCEHRNSDWDLRSTPAGTSPSKDPGNKAGVGRRAALATGNREFFGEWKMSYGERRSGPPPTNPPTHHLSMTPDPPLVFISDRGSEK
ncbi:hypothetical protein JOB18_000977 [Solea senegalensis]|uniref:Uncharacterized protein n=1 Tax=Solea senegalensis TaxID=28829 RepID=A0AAV6Q3I9_SOLSE|nr:hypothetical protein JOB18_000977 [Solea senegalensis]